MFDNEYCKVEYLQEENAVYLAWKKFSSGENYRKPTLYALELLKQYENSNFIIDARHGFEDEKEDVEWGFHELLPAMGRTTCKYCVMVMNVVNDIEGEMDMWTKEFRKYFEVTHTTNVEEALAVLHRQNKIPDYTILTLREYKERNQEVAEWFSDKWKVSVSAYLDSIKQCQENPNGIPQWYLVINNKNEIIAGCGLIDNDFHDRKDLSPNLCALYVDKAYRKRQIAKQLLDNASEDVKKMGYQKLYLITDHTSFYERYDWNFKCMVNADDGNQTRLYEKVLDKTQ